MSSRIFLAIREVVGVFICIGLMGSACAWSQDLPADRPTLSLPDRTLPSQELGTPQTRPAPAQQNPMERFGSRESMENYQRALEHSRSRSESAAIDSIRRSLEGQRAAPTRDGVLQEVLGVIKDRKSVLHGSELERLPGNDPALTRPLDASSGPNTSDERALAAENLLKSARLLSQLPGSQNDPLISMMRSKAAELLSR